MAQAPKLISETFQPVRPSVRYFITAPYSTVPVFMQIGREIRSSHKFSQARGTKNSVVTCRPDCGLVNLRLKRGMPLNPANHPKSDEADKACFRSCEFVNPACNPNRESKFGLRFTKLYSLHPNWC